MYSGTVELTAGYDFNGSAEVVAGFTIVCLGMAFWLGKRVESCLAMVHGKATVSSTMLIRQTG